MFWSCFGASTGSTESINEDVKGDPVYANNKLGKMQEGVSFTIRGTTYAKGERFLIDFGLENSTKDIALRLAAVITRNIIGRNSRINNSWGTEETSSVIPFTFDPGSDFLLQILFTIENIMVSIDGFHVAKFMHRLPYHNIRSLEIKGDVKDITVERRIVTDYPQRTKKSKHFVSIADRHIKTGAYDPDDYTEYEDDDMVTAAVEAAASEEKRPMPLPYYASFPKGFFDMGYSMAISGRVRAKPHSFKASLQAGQHIWPQPTVALLLEFQFNPRSDGETGEPTISRNSFGNGRWTGEMKSELATGLRPGADFHLVIVRGNKSFEIYMNDKPVTDYPYAVSPKYVDTLFVSGDLMLFNIEIEEND